MECVAENGGHTWGGGVKYFGTKTSVEQVLGSDIFGTIVLS